MKLKLLLGFGILSFPFAVFSQVNVVGTDKVTEVSPPSNFNTGLNTIYVVRNTEGCSLVYKAKNTSGGGYTTQVQRFLGGENGGFQDVTDLEPSASSVTVPLTSDDAGYRFIEGSYAFTCWVVNYANHNVSISGITPEVDCDHTELKLSGSNLEPIVYYSVPPSSIELTINRTFNVDYTNQEFNDEAREYEYVNENRNLTLQNSSLYISAPAYCRTAFIVSGDQFLSDWGIPITYESEEIEPVAVACRTFAEQEKTSEEGSNIINGDKSGDVLGGSAVAKITFSAYTTDAVKNYYRWQVSDYSDFQTVLKEPSSKTFTDEFSTEGTFYVRFICADDDNLCEAASEKDYVVTIGASALECPNAFSPNGDGVNDEWKVSYYSIIEFHCEIFNRNGQLLYKSDDISKGWDGTWHGKPVKSGVYYYVINATGADGKKYKKSGDINIINSIIN